MGTGLDNTHEGRHVRRLEVLDNDFSQFQVAQVDRAVTACPFTLRSMWISHFAFFDLCYVIWREQDEDVFGVRPRGTM